MAERIITAEALEMLRLVMRGCPKSLTNGGDKARRYLYRCSRENLNVSVCEFADEVKSWRDGIRTEENGATLDSLYDVYADVINATQRDVDEKVVIDFFAGQPHARKILQDIENEKERGYSELYRQKMLFAHMLVPLRITQAKNGRYFGIYEAGNGLLEMKNLLCFSESLNSFKKGEVALVHYGFVLKNPSETEHAMVLSANSFSELVTRAYEGLSGGEIDFENMHYFPRSLRIAAEAIE